MASRIKYKSGIGDISAELEISVEGIPTLEHIDEVMFKVNQKVQDLKTFSYQFETDESDDETLVDDSESDETGKIKPKLEIKPKTSELDVKIEEQVRKTNMYG